MILSQTNMVDLVFELVVMYAKSGFKDQIFAIFRILGQNKVILRTK